MRPSIGDTRAPGLETPGRGGLASVQWVFLLGVVLAGLLAVFLPWTGQDGGHASSPQERVGDEGESLAEADTSPVRVKHDDHGSVDEAALLYWKDAGYSSADFVRVFNRLYYDEGGREATYEYVEERALQRRGTDMEHHVESTIDVFKASGMRTASAEASLFSELVYGGDMAAGRRFESQGRNYREWLANRERGDLELPTERMLKYPLKYPGEMFVNLYSGGATGENIPQGLADDIARMRNGLVLQEALLYQEAFFMRSTIRQTAVECGLLIPQGDEVEAFSELHPEYGAIWEEMGQLELAYRLEIRNLMVEHGVPTAN